MTIVEGILSNEDQIKFLSKRAVKNSAWWDTHSSGRPVRARRDAERIEWSPSFNEYILPFGNGGNKFIVGRAVKKIIRDAELYARREPAPSLDDLIELLKLAIRSSVANHEGNFYSDYPSRFSANKYIEFGSHSISLRDFILTVLELSQQLRKYGVTYKIDH